MTAIRQLAITPDPKVEWVTLTPELATEWLGRNRGNRNKRAIAIASYARDMKNGNWLQTGDSIRFDINGRMIDGQHRCEGVIESGTPIRTLVISGLDPAVRDVLDTNVRRSAADALFFNGIEKYRVVIAAMARIDSMVAKGEMKSTTLSVSGVTNSEVVVWTAENSDAIEAAAWGNRIHRGINVSPSAAAYAIWRTIRIDADVASEFWNSLSNMQTEGPGDPRYSALRKLKADADSGIRSSHGRQIYILFRAWNAYRSGESLKTIPTGSQNGAILIPEPK